MQAAEQDVGPEDAQWYRGLAEAKATREICAAPKTPKTDMGWHDEEFKGDVKQRTKRHHKRRRHQDRLRDNQALLFCEGKFNCCNPQ